ncbi:MAG: hypothetical protein LBH94_03810, partial [Deltaproteobacteria bacterium]|nr:hypothetical protein [Deltaproteobacteria bacterium]
MGWLLALSFQQTVGTLNMKQLLKNIISLFGYNISRISHRPGSYIDCRETVLAAEKSGMSLPDYLDAAEPYPAAVGRSARIVKKILDMGLFSVDNRHTHGISMVEIGAGTGKYLARMLPGNITRCEIYEIDEAWSGYLLEQFAAMGMVFVH